MRSRDRLYFLPDLLERQLMIVVQAEALLEDVGLDGLEMLQQPAHLRDEVDELASILLADRTIERQRLIEQVAFYATSEMGGAGFAAVDSMTGSDMSSQSSPGGERLGEQ